MSALGSRRVARWRLARLALALSAAAMAAPTVRADAAPGCSSALPVVAYRATTSGARVVRVSTLPVACGVETGFETSETTIAVGNGGAIFFSPGGSENSLAVSRDEGASWSLATPPVMQRTSLWNTVDPDVVVDRATGRIFWVHTTYTDELTAPLPDQSPAAWLAPTALANAHGFQVFSTSDEGRSWTTADYRNEPTADWEKIFLGPAPAPASGAAQPVGYRNVVYVCVNAPQEVIGPGRVCYKSLDGGVTFTRAGYVFPSATAPTGCPALAANDGVVGKDGTIYIPQSCREGSYLAVSRDEGATYEWRPVGGAPAASGLGAVVSLAMDRAGNLYLLWGEPEAVRLVVSRDGGRTWGSPLTVSPPGLHHITLPALAAGARGAVGIVYYASTDPSAETLSGYVSQTTGALATQPLFFAGAINDPARPIFKNYGDAYSPRADFLGGAFDSAGTFWAAVVKQLAPPSEANTITTTGYAGRLTP